MNCFAAPNFPALSRSSLTRIAAAAVIVAALAGCSSSSTSEPKPAEAAGSTAVTDTAPAINPSVRGAAAYVRDTSPWQFDGQPGQIVKTDHFTIYTTSKSPAIMERLPGFVEAALQNYVTAIVPLEFPDSPMEAFVMATRPQWQAVSLQMLGARAKPLVQIRRGGFATMGRGFYFDIGAFDTLAVAGHEGWHQFTQRTFRDQMPLWLEEGVATYMEGHRWEGGSPRFLPWANVERFDHLRTIVGQKEVLSLQQLLGASSDQLIAGGGIGGGLSYYCQLWALVHFLNEGENGKYKAGLQRALTDASSGRMGQAVMAKLGAKANRMLARSVGSSVFETYFDSDLARVNAEYQAFIRQLVATGSREAIVAGRSPISPRPGN